ncbi:hypothetical protein [Parabacteroides sp. AF17-28]|uniref:hypothetical protein n=1 Tax=Parabacteroides sp. AF17-28 TaxID=2292241 RepID=UPI001313FDC3|nr:hypothetical protein [Parabacteroides sp. AF17-28]
MRSTFKGANVWMTAAEITDLFNVGGAQVNNAIKKIHLLKKHCMIQKARYSIHCSAF